MKNLGGSKGAITVDSHGFSAYSTGFEKIHANLINFLNKFSSFLSISFISIALSLQFNAIDAKKAR